MSPAQLLAHFDRISEAPGAIPRLRQFIRELAVRGRLVEQDRNETLASNLPHGHVERTKAFEIPHLWRWVRVGDVAECRLGKMLDKGKNRGYF